VAGRKTAGRSTFHQPFLGWRSHDRSSTVAHKTTHGHQRERVAESDFLKTVSLILKDDKARRLAISAVKRSRQLAPGGCYSSAAEGLVDIDVNRPSLVLVSQRLPDMCGFECGYKLARVVPSLPVIMLLDQLDLKLVLRALKAGCQGCVLWPATPAVLKESILKVHSGGRFLSGDILDLVLSRLTRAGLVPFKNGYLTPAEELIMEQILDGKDDKGIAMDSGQALSTVRCLVSHIYSKLGVHHRRDAIAAYLGFTSTNELSPGATHRPDRT
jgi:DNA-binding NarL/FixJ family response regulator